MRAHLLIVYVPQPSCRKLKEALFEAGAGRIGNYDHCCWQVEGRGQFRARQGAKPSLGKIGKREEVEETRLEMMVPEGARQAVDKALHSAHPYETPAYYWVPTLNDVPR